MNKIILKSVVMLCCISFFKNSLSSMGIISSLFDTYDYSEEIALLQNCSKDGFLDEELLKKMRSALAIIRKVKFFKNAHVANTNIANNALVIKISKDDFSKTDQTFVALNKKYGAKFDHYEETYSMVFDQPMDVVKLKEIYFNAKIKGIVSVGVDHTIKALHNAKHNPELKFRIETDGMWHFSIYSEDNQYTIQYDPQEEKIVHLTNVDYEIPFSMWDWCNIL